MVKESNIFIGLKKTCLGVLDRGERDKYNETVLKEREGVKIETTVLPLRDARSLRFEILTFICRDTDGFWKIVII